MCFPCVVRWFSINQIISCPGVERASACVNNNKQGLVVLLWRRCLVATYLVSCSDDVKMPHIPLPPDPSIT